MSRPTPLGSVGVGVVATAAAGVVTTAGTGLVPAQLASTSVAASQGRE